MEAASSSLTFRPLFRGRPSKPGAGRPSFRLPAMPRRDSEDWKLGSRMVDENMIVLRMRIQEMKMVERNYEAPPHWMEWEKVPCFEVLFGCVRRGGSVAEISDEHQAQRGSGVAAASCLEPTLFRSCGSAESAPFDRVGQGDLRLATRSRLSLKSRIHGRIHLM